VWGIKDSAFRLTQLAKWRESAARQGRRAPGAGHWPHEEEPAAVLEAVRGFVG
jgi:pimeloyl-ACP methyl ester carboxylesterase